MARFYCRLCNVPMSTVREKELHYSSRRHMDMLYQQKQQQQQHFLPPPEARTIVVTGFFPRTTESLLGNYFSRFGHVLNVYIDRRQNQAFVEFSEIQGVDWAVNFGSHILNKRRLQVFPQSRSYGPWGGRGKPSHFPSKGGPGPRRSTVRGVRGGKFQERRGQDDALRKKTGSVIHEDLCYKLNKCKDLKEQLKLTQDELYLSESNHATREQIRDSIEKQLREFFPHAYVIVYGSTRYNLALSKANFNLYLNLDGSSCYSDLPDNFYEQYDTSKVPSLQLLRAGEVMAEDIIQMPQAGQSAFVVKVLTKHTTNEFKRASPSTVRSSNENNALTIIHSESGIECMLKIRPGRDVRFSELISLYVRSEPRLYEIVPALAMWARNQGLFTAGSAPLNYPLFILLVIFFLQTEGVLPSVETLRTLSDKTLTINGVDCTFCDDPAKLPKSSNTKTSEELFKDFFAFYGNFDFTMYLISPYYGKAILKTTLPARSDATKDITPGILTLQDPFELSKNLTENVKASYVYNLLEKFKVTHERIQSSDFTKAEKGDWGIPLIVLKSIPHVFAPSSYQRQKYSGPLDIPLQMLFSCLEHVASKEVLPTLSLEELKSLWYEKVCHSLFQYLNRGYLFECEVLIDRLQTKITPEKFTIETLENGKAEGVKRPLDENEEATPEESGEKPSKKQCLDEENNKEKSEDGEKSKESEEKKENEDKDAAEKEAKKKEEEEKNILFKGHFKVYYHTLNNRKQALDKITSDEKEIEYLEQEHLLSLYLAKENGKKPSTPWLEFELALKKHEHGPLTSLIMRLEPKTRTRDFRFLSDMLQVRLSKIIEKILGKAKVTLSSAKKEAAEKEKKDENKQEEPDEQDLLKDDQDEDQEGDKLGEEEEATLLKE